MSSILKKVILELIESRDHMVYGSVTKREYNNFWNQTNAIEASRNLSDIAKEILKMKELPYKSDITQRSLMDRAIKKAEMLGFKCKSKSLEGCSNEIVSKALGSQISMGF